jgi:hypothetical protein
MSGSVTKPTKAELAHVRRIMTGPLGAHYVREARRRGWSLTYLGTRHHAFGPLPAFVVEDKEGRRFFGSVPSEIYNEMARAYRGEGPQPREVRSNPYRRARRHLRRSKRTGKFC